MTLHHSSFSGPTLSVIAVLAAQLGVLAADADHFEKKVRPLLEQHCLECHGATKQKGGLRLDSKEGWQQGGDSGPAITPGNAETSLMMKAVHYTDRDLKMPPKAKLSEAEVGALAQWITEGASDPRSLASVAKGKPKAAGIDIAAGRQWWSFQPIKRSAPPVVNDTAWPRNDIDRFILARLEAAALKPGADAPPAVLARRLAYDLMGAPLLESKAALAGDAEALTTEAFASSAYAERWTQHWLDAARFAESSGGGRTLPFKDGWRFRDYVIESIRDDVPLDRFIIEQIAGDLLPFESPAQRRRQLTATGFLALGAHNYEEQDKNLLRMDIVDEQMETIGKSLLGMTLGCARCHDHKFDPIPTRDYYALAGILRSTKSIRDPKDNVAHWVDTPLPLDAQEEVEMAKHEAVMAKLTTDLAEAKKALKKLTPTNEPKDSKARPVEPEELPGIIVDDEAAKKVGDWKHSTRYPTYIGKGYTHDNMEGKGQNTLTFQPVIEKAGRYEVRLAYMALASRADNVPVHILHADGEADVTVDQTLVPSIGGRFISLGQYRFEAAGQGYVMIATEGTKGYVTADAVAFIPVEDLSKIADKEDENADKAEAKDPALAAARKRVRTLEAEIKQLEKQRDPRPEVMSVAEHEDRGDCPIHIRGNLRNLGPKVPRGFLQVASYKPMPTISDQTSGRVELAQWVASADNPLTARVLVNRVWMHLFGEGLVRSVDNFGTTGDKPTHPELLDHLALKLIDSGWSLKALIRYITSSRVYRLDSRLPNDAATRSQLALADAENRLLSHQNRRRLDAHALRDTMLLAAGTLERSFMGPTLKSTTRVKDNDSAALNTEYGWVYDDLRRSLYTPAFRNKRLELFEAFDFADINTPISKRNTSTVAPQALFMLNHEFVVQQSEQAAARLLADETLPTDSARLAAAYARTLGRQPTANEASLALEFVAVSTGESEPEQRRRENWALLFQSLFASVDFRYLE